MTKKIYRRNVETFLDMKYVPRFARLLSCTRDEKKYLLNKKFWMNVAPFMCHFSAR